MHKKSRFVEELERVSRTMTWQDIGNVADPIRRNYLITHNYWRLAEQMAPLVGRENLSWPGFGAWASEQAGSYMRHEGLPMIGLVPQFGGRVTELLGQGNRLIFLDIAPVFGRFVELMAAVDDPTRAEHRRLAEADGADLPAYIQEVLSLDPRPVSDSETGQQAMVWAFTEYFLAVHEEDADARAEHIYVANCFVGLQEQMRVDAILDSLLDVPDVNRWVLLLAAPLVRLWAAGFDLRAQLRRRVGARHVPTPIERSCRMLHACVIDGRLTQVLGTQMFMEMDLGAEDLDIGEDVPWSSPWEMYPAHLARIDEDSAGFRARLDALLEWDRTPDTTEASAALDWSELADRMNYIVDLFRTRQQHTALHAHPLRARS